MEKRYTEGGNTKSFTHPLTNKISNRFKESVTLKLVDRGELCKLLELHYT